MIASVEGPDSVSGIESPIGLESSDRECFDDAVGCADDPKAVAGSRADAIKLDQRCGGVARLRATVDVERLSNRWQGRERSDDVDTRRGNAENNLIRGGSCVGIQHGLPEGARA